MGIRTRSIHSKNQSRWQKRHVLNRTVHSIFPLRLFRQVVACLCSFVLVAGNVVAYEEPQSSPPAEQSKLPNDQLDALVAPIALYPDPLLSQTLVASTYPLEVIQLQQWLAKNKSLKDKALTDAVQKQDWDPSVQ